MKRIAIDSKLYKITRREILIVFLTGVLIDIILIYLDGYEISTLIFRFGDWLSTCVYALVLNLLLFIFYTETKKRMFILAFLPFCSSIINLISYLFIRRHYNANLDLLLTICLYAIRISVGLYVVQKITTSDFFRTLLMYFDPDHPAHSVEIKNDTSSQNLNGEKKGQAIIEGTLKDEKKEQAINEETLIDRVINSLQFRANAGLRNTSFSLYTMIIIVLVGGSASAGTVLFSEVIKVHELEGERKKMLQIESILKTKDSAQFTNRINELKEVIPTDYGNEKTYDDLIKSIDSRSVVSWQDIAMRVTIAALTLFLVQIFFHIYKYNQQQVSQLQSKAEVLELFKESNADKEKLRMELLTKLDASPKFSKEPSTPIDQLINVLSKAKDAKG